MAGTWFRSGPTNWYANVNEWTTRDIYVSAVQAPATINKAWTTMADFLAANTLVTGATDVLITGRTNPTWETASDLFQFPFTGAINMGTPAASISCAGMIIHTNPSTDGANSSPWFFQDEAFTTGGAALTWGSAGQNIPATMDAQILTQFMPRGFFSSADTSGSAAALWQSTNDLAFSPIRNVGPPLDSNAADWGTVFDAQNDGIQFGTSLGPGEAGVQVRTQAQRASPRYLTSTDQYAYELVAGEPDILWSGMTVGEVFKGVMAYFWIGASASQSPIVHIQSWESALYTVQAGRNLRYGAISEAVNPVALSFLSL